jgi:hypothetical protein
MKYILALNDDWLVLKANEKSIRAENQAPAAKQFAENNDFGWRSVSTLR